MKNSRMIPLVMMLTLVLLSSANAGGEKLRQECEAKCNEAAAMIKDEGIAAAICEINKKDGRFVNGQVFVYMMNMDAVMMAHPLAPQLIGKNMSGVVLKDKNGKEHPMMLVNLAKNKGSGWASYMWPKPGEKTPSEKLVYILKVPETNVFVGAGFYMD